MLRKEDVVYTALRTSFDQMSGFDWNNHFVSMANESSAESKLSIQRLEQEWLLLKSIIGELLSEPGEVQNIYPGLVFALGSSIKRLFTHLTTQTNPPTPPQQFMNQIDLYLKDIASTANSLGLNIYFGLLKDIRNVTATLGAARSFIEEVKGNKDQISEYQREYEAIKGELKIVSLTKDFNARKRSVRVAAWVYAGSLVLITSILIGYSVYTAINLERADNLLVLTIKVMSIVPFACLITFLWRSYSRERHFEEEYAFRETLSGCLPSLMRSVPSENSYNTGHEIIKQIVTPIDYTNASKDSGLIDKADIRFIARNLMSRRPRSP